MADDREKILLSPGPVHVPAERWAGLEALHHRSDAFRRIVVETEGMLGELVGTTGPVYLVTASGTGVMETAVVNTTDPGSRVLVVTGGKFGDRWGELCAAYGCQTDRLRFLPDEDVDLEKIVRFVEKTHPATLFVTHVESSTGYRFPLWELARALPEPRPVLVVDAIASIGAEEFAMDAWGIDLVIGASQKALAAPPGIGFICVSERIRELVRRTERPRYYFSLDRYEAGRERGDTPFTPAVQIVQVTHASLVRLRGIGWSVLRERHRRMAEVLYAAAAHLALGILPARPSFAVQALTLHERCRGSGLAEELAETAGLVVADGQGPLAGRIIRTGFLGLHGGETLRSLVTALATLIEKRDCAIERDAAMAAVEPAAGLEELPRSGP